MPAPQARTDFGPAPAGYVAGRGRGMGENRTDGRSQPGAPSTGADNDRMDYSETNFDEFSGYSEALFGDTPYDKADEEADRVYEAVDERMESRRRRRQEVSILEVMWHILWRRLSGTNLLFVSKTRQHGLKNCRGNRGSTKSQINLLT